MTGQIYLSHSIGQSLIVALRPVAMLYWRQMPMSPLPSQSAEDYLERILELIEVKGYARVVDIAASLKVRRASVTAMVQKLADGGYLVYEKYRGLTLTPTGREVASRVQQRHATLSRFFSLWKLDEETQRQDIEGIEHHLSPETLECLASLTRFFEDNPQAMRDFAAYRNTHRQRTR